jgi:hypothetical protein
MFHMRQLGGSRRNCQGIVSVVGESNAKRGEIRRRCLDLRSDEGCPDEQ